jgi:nickel-dependent lactate racemase
MTVLRYGADSSVNLQLAAEGPLVPCGVPKGAPLADTSAAVRTALEQPLDYPSLAQCTTPGDRVAIALGAGVPQVAKVTAAIVQTLIDAGIGADGITILRSCGERDTSADDPCGLLAPSVAERISVRAHDPVDRRNLAYLAAFESGEPILLNRMLTDADVVLPVGCILPDRARGYYGIHTTLYPEFSDSKTQARFRKHDRFSDNGHHRELRREVNHVAWLLGVNFTVQIVPAAGDGILHVLAGQSDAVRHRGHELYREAWTSPVAETAELVVAAIEGGPVHQTWENLGRVLERSGRLVDEGGAIAVCCELSTPPGPAMQRLMGEPARDVALRQIRRENPRDLLPTLQLAKALESYRVYLLSRLDAELVEGLEMIPVESPSDISRLAQRSRSCLVVANAARAIVRVEGE